VLLTRHNERRIGNSDLEQKVNKDGAAQLYIALVNGERQYSLWSASVSIPTGWQQACDPCDREACLAHIERVWTDMRPHSLREA
jgi:MbtH protein